MQEEQDGMTKGVNLTGFATGAALPGDSRKTSTFARGGEASGMSGALDDSPAPLFCLISLARYSALFELCCIKGGLAS